MASDATLLCSDDGRHCQNFCFFLLDSFKTFRHRRVRFVREKREKKIKKARKRKIGGGGGLKPTLLVGRNIKM